MDIILDGCAYLQSKKESYRSLTVGISVICLAGCRHTKEQVVDFWRERVDYLQFVSEYYDIFRMRGLFFKPKTRTNCAISLIPLPNGKVAPCCAVAIYSHDHDVSWLPDLRDTTTESAYQKLCDMYDDPKSELASLCSKCDWWVQFQTNAAGNTPIFERIWFNPELA